jgi:hypothetical protein
MAAIRTEQQARLFAQLEQADRAERGERAAYVEPRSWPEIPIGFWFAASTILIGAFCVGFFMPSRHEPMTVDEMKMRLGDKEYRKTA